jgi:hypothetical protein
MKWNRRDVYDLGRPSRLFIVIDIREPLPVAVLTRKQAYSSSTDEDGDKRRSATDQARPYKRGSPVLRLKKIKS